MTLRNAMIGCLCLLAVGPACREVISQALFNRSALAIAVAGLRPARAQAPSAAAAPQRAPESHPRKSRPAGQTQASEKAVFDGMRWLIRHQNPDGSWGAASLKERCAKEAPCFDPKAVITDRYDPGLTGLALLCFQRAGFTHESKQDIVDTSLGKRHNIGQVVKNGLQVLVHLQNADGSFSRNTSFVYNEAIATMALIEAYASEHQPFFKEPAQRGVDFLQRAQRPSPTGGRLSGWGEQSRLESEAQAAGVNRSPGSNPECCASNTSATACCIAALQAAREAGLEVKDEAFAGALAFTREVSDDNGLVGYDEPAIAWAPVTGKRDPFIDHSAAMSAMGMCTRMFSAHDPNDAFLDLAAKRLGGDLPTVSADKLSVDYDYWYWGALALHQFDGPESPRKNGTSWHRWNEAMVESTTSLQDHSEKSCRNGGWLTPDRWSRYGGPIYTTAMSILALEVCYGDENAFDVRPPPQATSVGAKAPDVRAMDTNGQALRLAELAGRVVALDFWSRREIESKVDVAERIGLLRRLEGKPFVLISVGLGPKLERAPPEAARDLSERWRWFQAASFKSPLLRTYAVDELPTTLVIDAEGLIRARDRSWSESVDLIEKLVSETQEKNANK